MDQIRRQFHQELRKTIINDRLLQRRQLILKDSPEDQNSKFSSQEETQTSSLSVNISGFDPNTSIIPLLEQFETKLHFPQWNSSLASTTSLKRLESALNSRNSQEALSEEEIDHLLEKCPLFLAFTKECFEKRKEWTHAWRRIVNIFNSFSSHIKPNETSRVFIDTGIFNYFLTIIKEFSMEIALVKNNESESGKSTTFFDPSPLSNTLDSIDASLCLLGNLMNSNPCIITHLLKLNIRDPLSSLVQHLQSLPEDTCLNLFHLILNYLYSSPSLTDLDRDFITLAAMMLKLESVTSVQYGWMLSCIRPIFGKVEREGLLEECGVVEGVVESLGRTWGEGGDCQQGRQGSGERSCGEGEKVYVPFLSVCSFIEQICRDNISHVIVIVGCVLYRDVDESRAASSFY